MSKFVCPECKSDDVIKEYYMGAQTGDCKCISCGHVTSRGSFENAAKEAEKNPPKDDDHIPRDGDYPTWHPAG
jgi:transcription initiation factor TFIIIB Brf1 subunit/transcription initiation factor TFIIB